MKERIFDDNMFEAIFRQAVVDNFERELAAMPTESELAQTVFSERHNRRMNALFSREQNRRRLRKAAVWTKRFAASAAVVFFALSAVLFATPKVWAAVADVFVGWFDAFTKFSGGEANLAAADWEPSYVPDGFSEIFREQADSMTSVIYSDISGEKLAFTYVTSDNSISVNNENVEYSQITDGDIVYRVFLSASDAYKSSVVWDMDGYRFYVGGRLDTIQLLKIARSVVQKK